MRNRIKGIMVAGAIALGAIGVGSAATGTPVQAVTNWSCSYSFYPNPNGGARGRCVGPNPLRAYRVEILCGNGNWYYGSPQVYPTYSSKYCPFPYDVFQARMYLYP